MERHLGKTATAVILLIVVGAGLALTVELWSSSGVAYSDRSDILAEHLTVKTAVRRGILDEGRIPLWNPYVNAGTPSLANPQAMVFFPIDQLFLLLPLAQATNLVLVLNLLLAGVTMTLFCRRKVSHPIPVVFAALCYMLSYRYLAMIDTGWLPKMSFYALAPLLFWAIDRWLDRGRIRDITILSIVLALSLLQGDMQQLYYALLGAIPYIFFQLHRQEFRNAGRKTVGLLGASVLAGLLASPALLPTWEMLSLSTRSSNNYSFFFPNQPGIADALTVLHPADRGGARTEYWENNLYMGLVLYPLALTGFAVCRKLGIGLLACAFMMSLPFDSPVNRFLFDALPGYSLFRIPGRFLFLSQFALVILAALCLERLLGAARFRGSDVESKPPRTTPKGHRFGGRVYGVSALIIAGIGTVQTLPRDPSSHLALPALIAVSGLLFLLPFPRAAWLGGAVACLFPIAEATLRMAPRIQTRPLSEVFSDADFMKPMTRSPVSGRAVSVGRTALPYGASGLYDIDSINGYASFNLRHAVEYLALLQGGARSSLPRGPQVWTDFAAISRRDLLEGLDVRHILANEPLEFEQIGFAPSAKNESSSVFDLYRGLKDVSINTWKSSQPSSPAYFATSLETVSTRSQSLDALMQTKSKHQAVVFDLDEEDLSRPLGPGTGTLLHRGFNSCRYRIQSDEGGFLTFSQVWYPGWTAEIEGEPIRLYRTNHALLGGFVPPGEFDLVLSMGSAPLDRGLLLAMLGLIGILGLEVVSLRRRRNLEVQGDSEGS